MKNHPSPGFGDECRRRDQTVASLTASLSQRRVA
jgi:hypothetical protein